MFLIIQIGLLVWAAVEIARAYSAVYATVFAVFITVASLFTKSALLALLCLAVGLYVRLKPLIRKW